MTARPDLYDATLARALELTRSWLAGLPERRVLPSADADQVAAALGGRLPDGPSDPVEVLDLLARGVEPGLVAMPSGRFFGFVIGGTLPAALGADWLVSAWDQNTGLRYVTPGTTAVEEVAAGWVLDLLGLPPTAAVGFVTGGTMANFTGLAAGRRHVLEQVGWDLDRDGLSGAPKISVLVGAERHDTVDLVLRYLGLGAPVEVAVDDQGRIRPEALEAALGDGPAIVCLQAGNVHSGAFDPLAEAIAVAHAKGAWVHIDGAFGLWAAASPRHRHLVAGLEAADSWATDAHKTLNVPYDCGIAVVSRPAAMKAAMSMHGNYLIQDEGQGDPLDRVPELSRRARGVPTWAALRSLGRQGVADLVDRMVAHAQTFAEGFATIPGADVLNDVDFTQVCVSFGDDARTEQVAARLMADGTTWMSGSRWRDRAVLRVSVSNWSTDAADVAASLDAVRRAVG